jgi:NADP-dependent 3-hydroxy acid dehydrogenase YdfG
VASAAGFVTRVDRPVDVLVHCADVHVRNSVVQGPVEDLDEQYLVNLRGPYLLTQALIGPIREAGGHVVFVNPVDDATFLSSDTQYAMTRYGVLALAAGVREELEDAAVRVTTVHVGGEIDADSPGAALHPDDVADCVLGAVEMPPHLEITDLHVRPRRVRVPQL